MNIILANQTRLKMNGYIYSCNLSTNEQRKELLTDVDLNPLFTNKKNNFEVWFNGELVGVVSVALDRGCDEGEEVLNLFLHLKIAFLVKELRGNGIISSLLFFAADVISHGFLKKPTNAEAVIFSADFLSRAGEGTFNSFCCALMDTWLYETVDGEAYLGHRKVDVFYEGGY